LQHKTRYYIKSIAYFFLKIKAYYFIIYYATITTFKKGNKRMKNSLYKILAQTQPGNVHNIRYYTKGVEPYALPSLVTGVNIDETGDVTDVWVKVLLH